MSHTIEYREYPCKKTEKSILKEINCWAFDPLESGKYHGNMTFHREPVYKNRDEAMAAIKKFDKGFYSDHTVRYRDGRRIFWLSKIEYHT